MPKTTWNQHMLNVYRKNKKVNKDYKLGDAMKEAKKTWNKVKGGEELPELDGGKKDDMKKEDEELPELDGGKKDNKKDDMKKGGFEPSKEQINGLSPDKVETIPTKATGGKKSKKNIRKNRKTRKNKKSQKK